MGGEINHKMGELSAEPDQMGELGAGQALGIMQVEL